MSPLTGARVEQPDALARFVSGFLDPLRPLLDDDEVSEVLVNGPDVVFAERSGRLELTQMRFQSEAELLRCLRAIAQYLGKAFSNDFPILEGHLPDGSRVSALLPPLSSVGPCLAIRRHRRESLTVDQLVRSGSLSGAAVTFLRDAALRGDNVLVSGGTGTGKTSLLRCIAALIPEHERVITIEDARELHLELGHVLALETRSGDARGKGRVTIGDLFVATLRLRPDRIVIGELRGGEALDLVQAMTSGHGGCLSTVHASSPLDALRRVETLALMSGVDIPLVALRAQVASAVGLVVQVSRDGSGRRGVSEVARVLPLDREGNYVVESLFVRQGGRLDGELVESSTQRGVEQDAAEEADATPWVSGSLARELDAAFSRLEEGGEHAFR